ncbi:MAG: hypothetical protein J7K26_01270 [Candidatus Aenigmarchaeota archaeon]|nr:hypothetical protein [Candidatus Aenigmarchaeota archaeon]
MLIHFWDLPEKRNYVLFNKKFNKKIIKILKDRKYEYKMLDRFKNRKIKIRTIKKLSSELNIDLRNFEKNISWIGGLNSKGLSNPRLPFNFSNRNGARFISAIVNDGCLTRKGKNGYCRLMYDNFDKTIRRSVINDYLSIFGGQRKEIAFRNYDKKKYLEFTSVIRDVLELILKKKGPKTETNIAIPNFVFKDKENMLGWLEQTIADEAEIKYYPNKYRRSIVWRRSFDVTNIFNEKIKTTIPLRRLSSKLQKLVQEQKCNLIEGERKILETINLSYRIYNLGVYPTTKNKIRTKWQISITRRENLLKLRKMIKIPSKEKDKIFSNMCKEFRRYKEPLKIKQTIVNLGKNKRTFTAIDLKLKMRYKNISTTYKWLNKFEKEGLIKKIKLSTYGKGHYRKPAKYKLILNK